MSTNSTEFVFTHADLLALRVEYHAPTIWPSLKADTRETIHFRLTADGVQPAHDSFHVDLVDAAPTVSWIQDGDEDHVTATTAGNSSTLIAVAVTSGLALTAAIVAVIGIVWTVFGDRRPWRKSDKRPRGGKTFDGGGKEPEPEAQLPEVVLVSVSNKPASDNRPSPAAVVREPIDVDWSNVDPEILQHCRTTDPILSDEKVWV